MEINSLWIETPRENCCSVTQLCPTLCNPMDCSMPGSLSFTSSWSLLKLMSIESVMPSNHLILCHHHLVLCCPLLLLPPIFPSIRVFSSEWALRIRWPKYWSFNFSISPSKQYSGLISFREVQDTLLSEKSKGQSRCRVEFYSYKNIHPSAKYTCLCASVCLYKQEGCRYTSDS